MLHFEQGQPGQGEEILRFAHRAFATEYDVDFPALLPKLYGPQAACEGQHLLLYDGECLAGLLALQVQDFRAAGCLLRTGWIGTVCTAPEYRGQGLLAALMERANRLAEESGCDLVVLGGQRQRYQPFGYERAGTHWLFTASARNLRDVPRAPGLALRPMAREDVPQALALTERRPVYARRSAEGFVDVLRSWGCRPLSVWQGQVWAGYCAADGTGLVLELALERPELCAGVLAVLAERLGGEVRLMAGPWAGEIQRQAAALCEQAVLQADHSYRVLHWPQVVRAALALRALCGPPLCDGRLELDIEGQGGYEIQVRDGTACCRPQPPAGGAAVRLTPNQAVRLLFGPDSALVPGAQAAPAGWLPLPLCLPWADGI